MPSNLRFDPVPPLPESSACAPRAPSIAATAASPPAVASDRIDRSLPQGDVYFDWAENAGWNAFYEGRAEGLASGRGPKPADQMADAVRSTLQRQADARGVPMSFHTTRVGGDYRVGGRDANDSGADVIVRSNGSVAIATTQNGVANMSLRDELEWFPEKHDTGRLEHHAATWPANVWTADFHVTTMTGGER